jgi:hypothetical protein
MAQVGVAEFLSDKLLGVDYFMLGCGGFPALTTLEMLVHEVLPALNRGR